MNAERARLLLQQMENVCEDTKRGIRSRKSNKDRQ